jgi:hypothetical protein
MILDTFSQVGVEIPHASVMIPSLPGHAAGWFMEPRCGTMRAMTIRKGDAA